MEDTRHNTHSSSSYHILNKSVTSGSHSRSSRITNQANPVDQSISPLQSLHHSSAHSELDDALQKVALREGHNTLSSYPLPRVAERTNSDPQQLLWTILEPGEPLVGPHCENVHMDPHQNLPTSIPVHGEPNHSYGSRCSDTNLDVHKIEKNAAQLSICAQGVEPVPAVRRSTLQTQQAIATEKKEAQHGENEASQAETVGEYRGVFKNQTTNLLMNNIAHYDGKDGGEISRPRIHLLDELKQEVRSDADRLAISAQDNKIPDFNINTAEAAPKQGCLSARVPPVPAKRRSKQLSIDRKNIDSGSNPETVGSSASVHQVPAVRTNVKSSFITETIEAEYKTELRKGASRDQRDPVLAQSQSDVVKPRVYAYDNGYKLSELKTQTTINTNPDGPFNQQNAKMKERNIDVTKTESPLDVNKPFSFEAEYKTELKKEASRDQRDPIVAESQLEPGSYANKLSELKTQTTINSNPDGPFNQQYAKMKERNIDVTKTESPLDVSKSEAEAVAGGRLRISLGSLLDIFENETSALDSTAYDGDLKHNRVVLSGPDRNSVLQLHKKALAIFHVKAQAIEKPSVGRCYATEYFAVGWFDKRGGELTLPKIENARLTVPENAVSELTMFYFMLVYDACSEIAWPSFCPVMVCGPPGYYQEKITITLPSSLKSDTLKKLDMKKNPEKHLTVVSRRHFDDKWEDDRTAQIVKVKDSSIALQTDHFTSMSISSVDALDSSTRARFREGFKCGVFCNTRITNVYLIPKHMELERIKIEHEEDRRGSFFGDPRCWQDCVLDMYGDDVMVKVRPWNGMHNSEGRWFEIETFKIRDLLDSSIKCCPIRPCTRDCGTDTEVLITQLDRQLAQIIVPSGSETADSPGERKLGHWPVIDQIDVPVLVDSGDFTAGVMIQPCDASITAEEYERALQRAMSNYKNSIRFPSLYADQNLQMQQQPKPSLRLRDTETDPGAEAVVVPVQLDLLKDDTDRH